jgi:16S rRNA (adenine1518-N6/adenine1519-N6)-dimethyltransferase
LTRSARAFHTKRRLGQNFLIDPETLEFIAHSLSATPGETVIEIGPGIGFLTKFLNECGVPVLAVELDNQCVTALNNDRMNNVSITHGDFLKYDLDTTTGALKIVGNVPYQITTPIIARIFGEIGQPKPWLSRVERVVMTVQYEVAKRFVARPGDDDYSQITLLINYFAAASILRKVPREDFYPMPDVTSAIVEFIPLKNPPISCENPRFLRQVIKAGFSQRRKMIKNNLAFLHCEEADLVKAFDQTNINPQSRAETLSLQQFAKLSDALAEIRQAQSKS